MKFRAFMLVVLLPLAAAGADHQPSHVILPSTDGKELSKEQFGNQLREFLLQKLAADALLGMDAEQAKRRLHNLLRLDPGSVDYFQKIVDGDPEKLRRLVAASGLSRSDLQKLARQLTDRTAFTEEATNGDANSLRSQERDRSRALNQRINEILRDSQLDKITESLRNSPAWRDMMQRMTQGGAVSSSPISMGDFSSLVDLADGWANRIKGWLPDSIPALPKFKLSSPTPIGSSSSGGLSFPMGPELPEQTMTIVLAVVVSIAGVTVWRLSRQSKQRRRSAERRSIHSLVSPDRVNTREDLIRAFEHLALVFFGDDAAHWNHRLVASRLAESTRDREDADTLAQLYERARYAPASMEADWSKSREPLRRLGEGRP